MATPEILSMREFRAGLTGVLKRVQEPGADPVFVGAHRKAEAVLMSVEQYEQLQQEAAAVRREAAVAEALASVRAEGLEAGPEALERFQAVAERRITPEEALEKALAPYRR